MVGCTLPRAPAVRILSEGREGQLQGSSSGCLAAQIQRYTESTRLPGPLSGLFSPSQTEADSLGAQKVYDRPRFPSTLLPSRDMCMQETLVQSLGQEDLLEKGMAMNSGILAWRIPWTVEA